MAPRQRGVQRSAAEGASGRACAPAHVHSLATPLASSWAASAGRPAALFFDMVALGGGRPLAVATTLPFTTMACLLLIVGTATYVGVCQRGGSRAICMAGGERGHARWVGPRSPPLHLMPGSAGRPAIRVGRHSFGCEQDPRAQSRACSQLARPPMPPRIPCCRRAGLLPRLQPRARRRRRRPPHRLGGPAPRPHVAGARLCGVL